MAKSPFYSELLSSHRDVSFLDMVFSELRKDPEYSELFRFRMSFHFQAADFQLFVLSVILLEISVR